MIVRRVSLNNAGYVCLFVFLRQKGVARRSYFPYMFGFFMSSESRSFHLDTIIAFVISVPRKGEDKLKWRETKSVDQQTIHWFSEEDVFQIKKQASSGEYPFTLF